MATVLQLSKPLVDRSEVFPAKGFTIRCYAGEEDIGTWLSLRNHAFARERLGVREWQKAEFLEEFLHRWWWKPERMWLAESVPRNEQEPPLLVGAVTLAMRGAEDAADARAVVHWLMVRPRWQRRGIARLLMANLEAAAWDAGYREVFLETHAAWQAAARFYESSGYRQAAR